MSLCDTEGLVRELRGKIEEFVASSENNVSYDDMIRPGTSPYLTDACLIRNLKGNDNNVQNAFKQLSKTLIWRCKEKPWLPCPLCQENPMAHSIRLAGIASGGQPVVYNVFSQAHDRKDVDFGMKHLVCILEHCADALEIAATEATGTRLTTAPVAGAGTERCERWVLVADYDGFGLADCNPRVMMATNSLLAHYPERLDTIIMVDAPWAFWGLWKMVTPFLKESTKSKVKMVKSTSLERDAGQLLGTEMTAWLLAEINDNKGNTSKEWWEHRATDGTLKAHDARGTASFVQSASWRYNLSPTQIKSSAFDRAGSVLTNGKSGASRSDSTRVGNVKVSKVVEL